MEGNTGGQTGREIAGRLDFAFLKVTGSATVAALRQHVRDTERHGFRSLCLHPTLAGTVKKNYPAVRVCAVVSYPLGYDSLAAKTFTIQELIEQGVDEIDVVTDLFALVNGNFAKLELEANQLGTMCRKAEVMLKAIIETPILGAEQIRQAAEVLKASPVGCVKTSTGYGREPTSLEQVELLRDVVGREMRIKASGGIKDLYDVRAMIGAGADIIGTSNAVAIMEEVAAAQ
jgi:deoxyribose-phosphate aldolase